MHRYFLVVSAAALLAACNPSANTAGNTAAVDSGAAASEASATPATPTPSTPDFVNAAATTDMFEIQAAKIAEKRSTNADVKAFAAMMIHDHTQSTANLKAAIKASGASVTLPSDLPGDKKAKLDALTAAAPADFDKAYMDSQVAVHQDALGVMQAYGANGDTPQIKDFAGATASVVQTHLSKASAIRDGLK